MDPFTRSASVSAAARVRASWNAGPPPLQEVLASAGAGGELLIDPIVADAEERWDRDLPATLETYLAAEPSLTTRRDLCSALIMCEAARRRDRPIASLRADLHARFPALHAEIDEVLDLLELMRTAEDETPVLAPGVRLGKYELRAHLGAGGFGQVWHALDTELNRYVALKLFTLPVSAGGSTGSSRLIAEARAAAALDHDNIVRVHDAGVFEDLGLGYLDSQLAGDPDATAEDPLRVRIARSLEHAAPMPPREAARVIHAACRAVAAAHARAVLHRDIKPGNILLTPSGRVMVADFGLAQVATTQADGRVVGTPAYMSPEQARGHPATPQSDVFALGATLRFLLTGTPPYEPSAHHTGSARDDVLDQARRADLPPLAQPHIPRDLAAVVNRAMATAPIDRYTSADQLAADLFAFEHSRPVSARPAPQLHRLALFTRRHRAAVATAAIAVTAITASTIIYVHRVSDQRDRALTAEEAAAREMRRATAAEADALKQLEEALRQRDTALAINQYSSDTIEAALRNASTSKPTIQEAIDLAERRLRYSVSERPLIEAGVRVVLASGLIANKEHDRALKHLVQAVRIRTETLGPEAPDTLRARRLLAWARFLTGDLTAARPEMEAIAPLCERILGATDVDTGLAFAALGQWAFPEETTKAEVLLTKAELALRSGTGVGLLEWQDVGGKLGDLYYKQGRLRERTQLREAMAKAAESSLGHDDVRTLNARHNVARALWDESRLDETEAAFRKLVDDSIIVNGRLHAGTVFAHVTLADFLLRARRDGEAALALTRTGVPLDVRPHGLPAVRGPLLLTEARALAYLSRFDEARTALAQARADAKAMGNAGEKLARQTDALEKAIATGRAAPEEN